MNRLLKRKDKKQESPNEIPTPQAIHPREIVFAWKKGRSSHRFLNAFIDFVS